MTTNQEEWVVTASYEIDPTMDVMDEWSERLDAMVSRVPDRGLVDVTVYAPGELNLVDVMAKYVEAVNEVVREAPSAVEVVRESEWQRRATAPTLPELMSAAEIADELGVARQRVHQLRSTAAFPSPLAELRGGAVWDAIAVRKFARDWTRKPGRPSNRQARRTAYRKPDGRMIDLTYLESRGYFLTQADVDQMSPDELDRILRETAMPDR